MYNIYYNINYNVSMYVLIIIQIIVYETYNKYKYVKYIIKPLFFSPFETPGMNCLHNLAFVRTARRKYHTLKLHIKKILSIKN